MPKHEIEMTYSKSTPGTHVYAAADREALVKSIYLSKGSDFFKTSKPDTIILTVEAK